ncbi:MAG: hypothetical protein QF489_08025 [Planctomycetota bacterium]|jgi:hypothetical protein|nr:hypothetical protein [Planctomycetota bacterium]
MRLTLSILAILSLLLPACSMEPNLDWDSGDPFALVRLKFDS